MPNYWALPLGRGWGWGGAAALMAAEGNILPCHKMRRNLKRERERGGKEKKEKEFGSHEYLKAWRDVFYVSQWFYSIPLDCTLPLPLSRSLAFVHFTGEEAAHHRMQCDPVCAALCGSLFTKLQSLRCCLGVCFQCRQSIMYLQQIAQDNE